MEENNRINRRSRPRPYDLRRKVLLKNFLREQMAYIPGTQTESVSHNDVNTEEPTISLALDEDLRESNDENASSSVVVVSEQCSSNSSDNIDSSPVITDSKDNIIENSKDTVTDASTSSNHTRESSIYKFAGLIKIKRDSKKKQKGIVKAKEMCKSVKSPTKSKSFKTGLERVFYRYKKPSDNSSQNPKSRNQPRSLFSLFKYRRAQRNEFDRSKRSPCTDRKSFSVATSYTTMNQSVQTEDTWAREELFKVQQSNRLLREENRLLSESLSYFMSSSSMDSQINHCSSPLQSSNRNIPSTRYHDYFPSSSNASRNWNPRTRIARSKSVQEHSERRNILRNNYRTRSMNCHNVRNKFLLPDPKPSMSTYGTQPEGYNVPRVRRKNILANLPVNSSVRGIQRRSSMPERILSENDRSIVCRRSGSFRDTYNRKPFYSLPSEAFY